MKIRYGCILTFFGLSLATTLLHATISDQIDVSIAKGANGSHFVEGHFMIKASTNAVWETLTDYNGIGSFVSSIKSSRTVKSEPGKALIEQVMSGKFGFFHKKISVLLEISEVEPFEIQFNDISHKNFRSYYGSWKIIAWDNGMAVIYKLYATPDFFAPDFIANNVFKKNVRGLLEEVRKEISIRNNNLKSNSQDQSNLN